jgi:hypothetical protein
MKGGNSEPNRESRRAQLNMDRHTNSRLKRRYVEQAYMGYWLGPKRTWRKQADANLWGRAGRFP